MSPWKELGERLIVNITDEQARVVRELRVGRQLTWRAVAEEFYDSFPDVLYESESRGNQGTGVYLCQAAAIRLGEDPNANPWS